VSVREKWIFYLLSSMFIGVAFVRAQPASQRLRATLLFLVIVSAAILVSEILNWLFRKRS